MADEDQDDEDVEDAEDAEGGEGEETGKSGKKKLILIAAAALLLIGGGAGGAGYWLGWFGGGDMAMMEGEAALVVKKAVFYDLPDMTVNLSTAETQAQYLKLSIALELPNSETISLIEPFMPRVLDAFQTHLRELRMTDLEGSAGLYRLKEELARRINLVIHPARVDAVLFKQIIVQ